MFKIAIFEILEIIIAVVFIYAGFRIICMVFKTEKKLLDKMENEEKKKQ